MPGITGMGTTYNLPNYVGELFAASREDTPLLSAIGGLTGGRATKATSFEWQGYDLRDPDDTRQRLEGADAPDGEARTRYKASNVVEIHQEAVNLSYTKQGATGQLNTDGAPTVNIGGTIVPADELGWQISQQIKQIEPSCIPLGYDSEANWFITMCEQYGSEYTSIEGENFRFDNETNRNFVKKFRTWFENKWVTTETLSGGYTSSLFTGESSSGDAVKTRCYMCIGSTGGATYQQPNQTNGEFEFEVGITTIPQVNPNAPKVISQGPSVCIFKSDDPQEVLASWLFAKYLSTDVTFQARVSMNNGYAPVISSVKENPIYAEFLDSASTANIQAYAVKVALDQADAYYVSPAFNGSSVARDQVGLLMQKCLSASTNNVDDLIKKTFEAAVSECKYQSGQ